MRLWGYLLSGAILIASGIGTVPNGSYSYGKFLVPDWAGWILLLCGVSICALTIRGWRRGEGRDPVYTDEDAKRAKAELDTLYLRDHGTPPEAPEEEKKKP